MLVIKKISTNQFNLTCTAHGNFTLEGLSLSGPNSGQNNQQNGIKQYRHIELYETSVYADLPPVLDQQWEDFTINGDKRAFVILRDQYLWISVRHKKNLIIRNEKESLYLNITCKGKRRWVHLQLQLNSTHLSVMSNICSIEDPLEYANENNVQLFVNSFYKEHRYNNTTITENTNGSKTIDENTKKYKFKMREIYKNHIRLSYYLNCSSCTAKIWFELASGEKDSNKSYLIFNNLKWNTLDIEIKENEEPNGNIDFVVVVKYLSNTSVTFVIRNMFIHEQIDDRSISMLINSTDVAKYVCESMVSNVNIVHGSVNDNDTKDDVRFPQSKLCYSNGTCYCSSGSFGDMCEKPCEDGKWGNCLKECDCCNVVKNTCDKVNGSCGTEVDCQKSRSIESVILNSSSTSINVTVNLQRDILQKKINSIKIEYGTTEESEKNNWKELKYENNLNDTQFNIIELKPNTNYSIRTSLCAELRCFSENGYISNITTTCDKPVSSELNLEAGQDKVLLIFSNYSSKKGSCPQFLSVKLRNNKNNQDNKTEITGRTPYTEYYIDILFQGEIIDTRNISTKKAKASAVHDLQFNENQSLISWRKPNHPNGNLGIYYVKITRLGSILCDDVESIQHETENLYLPLKVVPYSKYEVIVEASNEEGRGLAEKISFQSSATSEIGDNEKPIKFNIDETHLAFEIKGCHLVFGPWIIYDSVFTCLDSECLNNQIESVVNVTYTRESEYVLPLGKPLAAYSNYTVTTSIYRSKDAKTILINTATITTQPQCPPPVRYLDVYSVNNSSISVRWKVPLPHRGVLEKVVFKYQDANRHSRKIYNTNMKNCSLWDDTDYFCATLNNLTNHLFPIDVIAFNFNTSGCTENEAINQITLQETESEAPIDLKSRWKGDMEELELTWKHPNKTNGQLKNFIILLNSTTKESKNISEVYNIPNESRYYNYSIKSLKKSTKYNVEVIPVNAVHGSSVKLSNEIVTPPPYPVIDSNTEYLVHGNYYIIHIPSIKNTSENSSICVIISDGNCKSAFDSNARIGTKDELITDDVVNKTIKIDLENDFNTTNIPMPNDFSITILVINEFGGISRNASRCLRETSIKLTTASTLYVWIGFVAFLVLLIVSAILIFKYGLCRYRCESIKSKIFQTRRQNNLSDGRKISNNNESIELMVSDYVRYQNQPLIPKSHAIYTKKFLQYLKSAVTHGDECELYTDFDSIPLKINDFENISNSDKSKNRYLNILPYKDNKVILKSGRYINASLIQGYKTEGAYIATQGPKLQTIDDFWEMVFEHNVNVIAMLCPLKEAGKVKCDQYWPDFRNKILPSRNLEIEFDSENNCGVYIERYFNIICDTIQRQVIQLQFIAWNDHKIPSSSQFLLEFLTRFNELHDYRNPAVVHCSAGSGRTGTLILCDYLLKMEKDISSLDFLLVLCNLRQERTQMVQTKQQYHFAHVVIYEYLCIGKNHIACDDNFEANVLKIIETSETIQKQMQLLENFYAIDVTTFTEKNVTMENQDVFKNRDDNILPTYSGIIYLQTTKRAQSTYINAINVDSWNQSEKFIVTQQPLISSQGSTIADFWRLVFQTKPEVIVSLQGQVINFYPTQGELLVDNYITLKCIKRSQNQSSKFFTVKIIMGNEDFTIKIMESNAKLEATLDGLNHYLNFYTEYRNNYSHKERTVLVTCLNGCELSGVFVALDYTVEKMMQREICDVFLAVRAVRRTRPNFITTEEQFRFLYRCALEFRKSMCSIYSNIS